MKLKVVWQIFSFIPKKDFYVKVFDIIFYTNDNIFK